MSFNMGELPQAVIKLCNETHAEPVYLSKDETLMFIVPKLPSGEVQAKMIKAIPFFIKTQWVEGLKTVTTTTLNVAFAQIGATGDICDRRHGRVEVVLKSVQESPYLEKESPLWNMLITVCKADGYPSTFKVILKDKVIFSWDKDMERMLTEHIETGLVIRQDDILNLTIALNSTKSVEEFLATI